MLYRYTLKQSAFSVLLILMLFHTSVQAQDATVFSIELGEVTPPTKCTPSGWSFAYERTTTLPGPFGTPRPNLTLYFVQYVDDQLNLVHYWGTGYSQYVQDYAVDLADILPLAFASYDVPLWSDTYHAVTTEYVLAGDDVLWELRAELDCDQGEVRSFSLTTQAASGSVDDLPQPEPNLVLALEDIPRYRLPATQTDYLGTIEACQTFYISAITHRRASFSVSATDSLTNQPLLLNGVDAPRLVDVPEDYGQAGGAPILDQCVAEN